MKKFFSEATRYLLEHESRAWLFAACVLFAVRLLIGRMAGCHILTTAYHDDMLMIRYADLIGHFITHNLPPQDLLVKDMSFPLMLRLVKFTGIAYTDFLALLWFLAALSVVALFRTLTAEKNLACDLAIFAFVLFAPVAFEYPGVRVYRTAAIPPLYFVVLSLMALQFAWHFIKHKLPPRRLLTFEVVLGFFFALTYYVKEDGIWLLMCLASVTTICFVKIIFDGEQIFRRVAILMIPLMIFAGGTIAYKSVNKICFGVYLINNRTEGELGKFQQLIYKIKSDERTASIWTPTDALAQAFDASETLRQAPALREAVWHTDWFNGDITTHPIDGDFLGWVMLRTLYDSGTCKTLADQENFLGKVNAELNAAFETGQLQRDDRFQLVSSMGSMTTQEIFSLLPLMAAEYLVHVTLQFNEPCSDFQNAQDKRTLNRASKVLNMDLAEFAEPRFYTHATMNFLEKMFALYSVIQTLLFVAANVGVVGSLWAIIRNKKSFSARGYVLLAIAAGNLLLSVAYALAIAWFCEYLYAKGDYNPLKWLSVGFVPMLMTFEIFGTYLLWCLCKQKF